MPPIFALVDCNNFYASCEKLFRPDLATRPVVVLSNNDGCVVARSKEAKQLGIKMGVPYFQIRSLMQQHGIVAFSSNYALYADMSARVMRTLEEMAPQVEVYSIDEAFLDLTGLTPFHGLTDFGQQVRARIAQWMGIQVCVGIAPSKTLAKLANHAAKTWPATAGVVDLTEKERQRKLMALLPVSEVWGIGGRLTQHLHAMGITTALDLADACPQQMRRRFSLVVERIVQELNGESCLALEDVPATKKQIISSRSFGKRIEHKVEMQQALAEYVHRACRKLRQEGCKAKHLTVFLRTSPFSDKMRDPYYANSRSASLSVPSDDTRDFLHLAQQLLQQIWLEGYRYAKAGVMLADFYPQQLVQEDLFDGALNAQSTRLMEVLDQVNEKVPNALYFASKGTSQSWQMKRTLLSPAYTTSWQGLPRVK